MYRISHLFYIYRAPGTSSDEYGVIEFVIPLHFQKLNFNLFHIDNFRNEICGYESLIIANSHIIKYYMI